jgi:hypothetical protein
VETSAAETSAVAAEALGLEAAVSAPAEAGDTAEVIVEVLSNDLFYRAHSFQQATPFSGYAQLGLLFMLAYLPMNMLSGSNRDRRAVLRCGRAVSLDHGAGDVTPSHRH